MVTPVLMLASGRGERLRPLTDDKPKPLVPVLGVPLIDWMLERLRASGFDELYATTWFRHDRMEGHLNDVVLIREERLSGPAGAVISARPHLPTSGPVLVLSADALTAVDFEAMVDDHQQAGAYLTVCATPSSEPWRFGVLDVSADRHITAAREKDPQAPPGSLVSCGMYVLSAECLRDLDAQGRDDYDFGKHLINEAVAAGRHVHAYVHDRYWEDVGSVEVLRRTESQLRLAFSAGEDVAGLQPPAGAMVDP